MHDGSPTASGRLKGSVHRVLLTQRRSPSPSVDMRCAALRADTLRSEMLERAQSDFTMQSEDFPALPGFRAAQARLLIAAGLRLAPRLRWDCVHAGPRMHRTFESAHICADSALGLRRRVRPAAETSRSWGWVAAASRLSNVPGRT